MEPIVDWWEPGTPIGFVAEDVIRERTGTHARLYIRTDAVVLAWSRFNTDRDEDRVRLANAAHKALSKQQQQAVSPSLLKAELDRFCAGLWRAAVGQIKIAHLEGKESAPRMIVTQFVIDGGSSIIFALPGQGKSYTALLLAVSIDSGCQELFDVRCQTPVLYVNLERSAESMQSRLAKVNKALGLPMDRTLPFLNVRGKSLNDVIDAIAEYVKDMPSVVFVDSISRAGMGDLEKNSAANNISDALNGACSTWVGIAHTPRNEPTHVFGSVHFDAAMDIGIQLISDVTDTALGVGLKVTKANDVPRMKVPYTLALEFNEDGLVKARRARASEFNVIDSAGRSWVDDARDFLLRYGKATAQEIGQEVDKHRSEVSRVLGKHPGIRSEREGRKVLFSVVG